MKKSIFGILLSFVLMMGMIPVLSMPVYADEAYDVTVVTDGNGAIAIDPYGPVRSDTTIKLTAVPNEGYDLSEISAKALGKAGTLADIITAIGTAQFYNKNSEDNYSISFDGNALVLKSDGVAVDTCSDGVLDESGTCYTFCHDGFTYYFVVDSREGPESENKINFIMVLDDEHHQYHEFAGVSQNALLKNIELTPTGSDGYTFSMPAANVIVSAAFEDITFPLWVNGVQVTKKNKDDVLSDGLVSYDPATNTLKLDGADITVAPDQPFFGAIRYKGRDELIIDATKPSTVTGPEADHGINTDGDLTLNGTMTITSGETAITVSGQKVTVNGKVNVHGGNIGILLLEGGDLTVNSGAELTVTGDNTSGIGVNPTGTVTVRASAKVTAVGGTAGAIDGTLKNDITGTGWTEKNGTAGETAIAVNASKEFNELKKVQFPAKQYTISYDLDGGTLNGQTGTVTKKVDACTDITLPAPAKDGCTFDYWEGSKYNAGDKYTVTGDHIFKAVWKTADPGNDDQDSTDGSDDSSSGKSSSGKKGVKTGDENSLSAWIVLLLTALTGTAGMVFARKRR